MDDTIYEAITKALISNRITDLLLCFMQKNRFSLDTAHFVVTFHYVSQILTD